MIKWVCVVASVFLGQTAWAQTQLLSDTRPAARPNTTQTPIARPVTRVQPPQPDIIRPIARAIERPDLARGAGTQAQARAENNLFAFSPTAVARSLRPELRTAEIMRKAAAQQAALRRGLVCGDPAIQGARLGTVPGPGRCGVEDAVQVRSILGVGLTSRAIMNCRTARAMKTWVANGARPVFADVGGGLSQIRVIGTYSCRNRNSASTGRLSEHAFGNAVDIAAFRMHDGREITVLNDWNTRDGGARLKRLWRAACGPFGTVLGPEANRFHRDHFHFDTARYRSGSYCR